MIKRLFSVVITVSLAVASLGAMEQPNKPNKSSGSQDIRRARVLQRRLQRGQQPAPAPAPQRPVNQNRPAKAKAKAKQANQGQRRPGGPGYDCQPPRRPGGPGYNCQPPQNQHDEYQEEDDSSSCDCPECACSSSEDDSSDESPWNNPSIQLRTGNNNNNNNIVIESPRHQEARPANQPVANRAVEGDCTICTEALHGDPVAIVPCNHNFHRDCIERWRRTRQEQANSCPICRAEITRLQPVGK